MAVVIYTASAGLNSFHICNMSDCILLLLLLSLYMFSFYINEPLVFSVMYSNFFR